MDAMPNDLAGGFHRNGISPRHLSKWGAGDGGVIFMPTVKEYRQKAKSCLDLAKEATNLYAKEAMVELEEKFSTAAELLEHPASKH
jgi:hypothetical protein